MVEIVIAILAGVLLLSDLARGKAKGAIGKLQPFGVVIGVVALVLGVLHITSVLGVALLLAGFILAVSALKSVPRVGDDLARAGNALERIRTPIGAIVLIIGLIALVRSIS